MNLVIYCSSHVLSRAVPLSVLASAFPTTGPKAPEVLSVRAAVKGLQNIEISDEDILTYSGRSAPNSSRIRECRRKSVVVDKISPDSTAGTRQLLSVIM